jgi:hypothetical protein
MNRKQTLVAALIIFVGATVTLTGNQDTAKSTPVEPPKIAHDGLMLSVGLAEPDKDAEEPCWSLVVTIENPTQEDKKAEFPLELTSMSFSPMSRAMPMPRVIKTEKVEVTIAAGKSDTVTIALPKGVAPKTDDKPALGGMETTIALNLGANDLQKRNLFRFRSTSIQMD